jgi:hypothetical protein
MTMKKLVFLTLILSLVCSSVFAQADPPQRTGFRGWGPRIGLTIDPDQFHFGGHMDLGYFAEHVRVQPNFELGFGDDLMLAAANLEGAFRFATNWDVWTPYLGGGLGINFYEWEDDHPGRGNGSDTELGVNLLGGIEKGISNGDRFFIEIKLGFADSPDFKATVGWTFFY